MRFAILGLACLLAAPAATWKSVYFFDREQESLQLFDFAMPAADCGIALGIHQDGRSQNVALRTRDGGLTWAITKVKPEARSLFFLDGEHGWMVAHDGIYKTSDCGGRWERVKKERNLVRVHFLSPLRGYAMGAPKVVLVTGDGGKTWDPLPAAAEPKSNPERSVYTWAEFHPNGWGMITGSHRPDRRTPDAPVWMDPEATAATRQWPSLSLVLQTADGGITWKSLVESVIGAIGRVRMSPNGAALVLVEFQHTLDFPSDVLSISADRQKTQRVYRRKDHAVTDILFDAKGRAYVAGYVPPGKLRDVPIPGRVRIERSDDLASWEQLLDVDYRAVARRVMLARGADGTMWAATDTGMILRLEE
ncbi:MAG: hypothetical protein R2729_15980 [Bryobacteraceae bacterium]